MKPIKIIIVGYGNMGKDWGKVIKKQKTVQVVGIVDKLKNNRNHARNDFCLNENQVSDNLTILLTNNNKVDAIIDCSPPFAHFDNTVAVLNNNSHILGEKPISLNLKDAKKLVKLSKRKKLTYMINQNYRRNPILTIIKEKIKTIGKIYSINIDYFQSLKFNDTFRYKFDHPILFDMAIHHFDMVRFLTGENASEVYAREYNPITSKFKNGSGVIANFIMKDNSIFSYRGSWSSVGFNTSYNGVWRINGEYGTISWDGDLNLSLEIQSLDNSVKKEKVKIINKFDTYELFLYELEQNLKLFSKSILNKTIPDCWCGDNIHSLAMVLSAIESSETKKIINIKPI